MYNESQKLRYLNNSNFRFDDSSKDVIRYMFEGAEKVEKQEDMDLSQFNRIRVVRLLKSYNSKSRGYLRLICNNFSDYYNWCISEGYIDKKNVDNYYDYRLAKPIIEEVVPLTLIKDKYIFKEDILEYLDSILDEVNKLILYAPFVGIYGEEYEDLCYLKLTDINKEEKTVKLKSDKIIKVDDLFIELAEEADNAIMYYPKGISGIYKAKKPNRYKYDESCYVIKNCGTGTIDAPVSKTVIMNRFRLMQKQLDNKFINGGNLYKNGLINYIKERFEEKNITLKQALFEKNTIRGYTYAKELQQYINEFGSQMTDRMIRMQMQEVIDLFD